jgi:hypothetical protein
VELALKWLDFGLVRLSSDRRATLSRLFSALKGTNGSTNFKRQRDDFQGGAALMLGERDVVYYPEELTLLGSIFDEAIASLPAAKRTPANRTEIAKNILRRAAAGERDPVELGLAAVTNLTGNAAA